MTKIIKIFLPAGSTMIFFFKQIRCFKLFWYCIYLLYKRATRFGCNPLTFYNQGLWSLSPDGRPDPSNHFHIHLSPYLNIYYYKTRICTYHEALEDHKNQLWSVIPILRLSWEIILIHNVMGMRVWLWWSSLALRIEPGPSSLTSGSLP